MLDSSLGKAAGLAGFDMANLQPSETGLPFVVFISHSGAAPRCGVKVAPHPKVSLDHMASYAPRPCSITS
jgi:hypothetical protein